MSNEEQPARANGLIERAFAMIERLIAARQPMSMTAISEATGIDTSSAHRILKILTDSNYVLRDPRSKRYLPGPKALYPLGLFHPLNVVRRDAVPVMRSLAQETGQTVAFLVFVYGERIVLDLVHGAQRMAPFYETHVRRPLHSSASGKVLLMKLTPQQRAEILGPAPYASFTANTIAAEDRLESELAEASRCGYARAVDETYVGVSAVAAPVRSTSGEILGCFALFGLSREITPERLPELGEQVKTAAQLFTYMSTALEAVEVMLAQP